MASLILRVIGAGDFIDQFNPVINRDISAGLKVQLAANISGHNTLRLFAAQSRYFVRQQLFTELRLQ